MRRTIAALVMAGIVVCLTTSVAMSAMRINRLTFSAVSSVGGAQSLATAGRGAMTLQADSETSRNRNRKIVGACVGDCTGLFLHAEGRLVEIESDQELTVVTEATGIPVVTCVNAGGNEAPGQNPPDLSIVDGSGGQQIGVRQISRKGAAKIDLTIGLPSYSFPGSQMGCPNDNWTATITSIQFTSVTISVFEGETLLLTQTFEF